MRRVVVGLPAIFAFCFLILAADASADTARVAVDQALVWNRPSGVSVVMTQFARGTVVDVVRRVGDWYEIVMPLRAGVGPDRPGYIRANQVMIQPGPPSVRAQRLLAPQAAARRPSARSPGILFIDGGFRAAGAELTRRTDAFTDEYAEAGTISANYGKGAGAQFGIWGGQFIFGSIGFGLGITATTRAEPVEVEASVPHPLYFDTPRAATFETTRARGREFGIHVPVFWTAPSYGSLKIVVFGGPSFFRLTQDTVVDLELDEEYPFDDVTISDALTESRNGSAFGFHAGADVSYFFGPTVGLGGGVRFSRGSVTLSNEDATTDGRAGGIVAAGGFRFRF